jgi:hypothetical protein
MQGFQLPIVARHDILHATAENLAQRRMPVSSAICCCVIPLSMRAAMRSLASMAVVFLHDYFASLSGICKRD